MEVGVNEKEVQSNNIVTEAILGGTHMYKSHGSPHTVVANEGFLVENANTLSRISVHTYQGHSVVK